MNLDQLGRRELFERAFNEGRDPGAQEAAFKKLERSRVWEDEYEWRISTYGTERIERLATGFRASAEFNGRFRVDLATFEEAWEALRLLQEFGTSLFYALGWTEDETTWSLRTEPDRGMTEAYLKCLGREAADRPPGVEELRQGEWRANSGRRILSVVTAPRPAYWSDDAPERIYVVTVQSDSLVLECDCTTPERAHLFLGVFDAMAADLLEILDWKPLKA